jgi:DNA-binding NtrC family response regulator
MNLAEKKVLALLEKRKVTADEAADLIDSIRAQIEVPTKGRRLATSIVGDSSTNQKLHSEIAVAAALDGPMMVVGEKGTGKMLISRTVHFNSRRADRQFLLLDCTSETVSEELFGVEPKKKGASVRRGMLDVARGGSIALDMLSEMDGTTQEQLYAFLQTGQFRRVGGSKTYASDVRVIGVCHGTLAEHAESGAYNADLYQALTEVTIYAPALRDRLEDLPAMVSHFVSAQALSESKVPPGVSEELLDTLRGYDWPENASELSQVIRKAVSGFKGEVLGVADVKI